MKWTKLNLREYPELDEVMSLAYDVINLDLKINGKLSDETKEKVKPAFEYLMLIKKQLQLRIELVDPSEL
jgi:hypothetical protein